MVFIPKRGESNPRGAVFQATLLPEYDGLLTRSREARLASITSQFERLLSMADNERHGSLVVIGPGLALT